MIGALMFALFCFVILVLTLTGKDEGKAILSLLIGFAIIVLVWIDLGIFQ